MKEKVCTKCGLPKSIREFGKRGKKRSAQCKECVNKYHRGLRNKNIPKNPEEDLTPIFEKKASQQKVQRKQMVVLQGETDKFIKIICPCGLPMHLEYNYSFDQKNDYYEATCPACSRTFKQTITQISN